MKFILAVTITLMLYCSLGVDAFGGRIKSGGPPPWRTLIVRPSCGLDGPEVSCVSQLAPIRQCIQADIRCVQRHLEPGSTIPRNASNEDVMRYILSL